LDFSATARVAHRGGHRLGDVGILEDDEGRLAAKLLMDPFHRVGRRLGDGDPGPGRAGEGDHVDVGMGGDGGAYAGPVAVDEVEHPGRDSGGVDHLGEEIGRERRDLGRLEDHRAAGRERREDLCRDLVDRPVPRRDEAAHSDRLLLDQGRAALGFELIVLEDSDRRLEVADTDRRLGALGERRRSPHLLGDRLGDLGVALLIFARDRLEQFEPLLAGGLRKGREGGLGRGHRPVDVLGPAQADPAGDALVGRVDDVEGPALDGLHP
jgi:hypothetical protein